MGVADVLQDIGEVQLDRGDPPRAAQPLKRALRVPVAALTRRRELALNTRHAARTRGRAASSRS